MSMSRADFEAVAQAVAWAKADTPPGGPGEDALRAVTRTLADACTRQHRGMGFNRPRFYDACGFPHA